MRYPLLVYHSEIKKYLFNDIFPKTFDLRKPEIPLEKKFNDNVALILDGLVFLGVIFVITGIVGLSDGTRGSFGGIILGLVMTFLFYSLGANSRKEQERVQEDYKKKKKEYDLDMLIYNKAKREYQQLKEVEKKTLENLAYRNKLVSAFLDKTSTNRKQKRLPLEKVSNYPTLNDFRFTLLTKFSNIASISEIQKKDGTSYVPFLCLNIINSNMNIIIDIDDPHLKYYAYEYEHLYSDSDIWDAHDDHYNMYLHKKFHESLSLQNAELAESGYIIIKFTNNQIVNYIDKTIATILKILIYLKIYDTKTISSNFNDKEFDLSLSYEFEKNIFTFS